MLPAYLSILGCVAILIILVAVSIVRSGKPKAEEQAGHEIFNAAISGLQAGATAKKGFQVGDRVIVVRNLDDDSDTVDDFTEVYGRIGEVVACRSDARNSIYEYYVKFEGWDDGWADDKSLDPGPCWGVYNKNLRRVSKIDQR